MAAHPKTPAPGEQRQDHWILLAAILALGLVRNLVSREFGRVITHRLGPKYICTIFWIQEIPSPEIKVVFDWEHLECIGRETNTLSLCFSGMLKIP